MSCDFLKKGRPTLTVMVQAKSVDRILELIDKGLKGGADAFGVQIEVLEHKYRNEECFKRIFSAMQGKPAYVTNYRTGINGDMSDEERTEQLLLAAKCGAKLIDIMGDLFNKTEGELTHDAEAIQKQEKLIKKIHSMGAEVLMSSHTYKFMPEEDVVSYVTEQHRRGADIAKVVTGAADGKELSENIRISAKLSGDEFYPALFLCTGDYCGKHRIVGPMICGGMFLCVVEHDELATPAQPLLEQAKSAVKLISAEG